MRAIVQCQPTKNQFISPIFLIKKSNGKRRLILNLKSLNSYLSPDHFKLEDIRTALKLMNQNCFLASVDLKDAYFLINVNVSHRKYLRFTFNNHLYEFTCMPFGICTAPFVSTKLMKPIVAKLRETGLLSVVYLDDFLLFGNTWQECKFNVSSTCSLLQSLGFVINKQKSQLQPANQCRFLGFILDSKSMQTSLPPDRKSSVSNTIKRFSSIKSCTIRQFASFVGKLVSVCPAVQYGWAYTKEFERVKYLALQKSEGNYNRKIYIPNHLKPDFEWWKSNIILPFSPIYSNDFIMEIFSDASTTGWGVVCNGKKANGFWTESQKTRHINYLELPAAFLGLNQFAKNANKCEILLRIDNTTAIAYINRQGGTRFPALNGLAKKIWQWCEKRQIRVFASYISSSENKEADFESRRLITETEWELSDSAFAVIVENFGLPTIDLFASANNKKCPMFVSWKPEIDAQAIDAFTISWTDLKFYAFPPFSLNLAVIKKIIKDKAEGILVVPWWPNQPWFPLLQRITISHILLSPSNTLLTFNRTPHPLWKKTTLAAAAVSGKLMP
ncbi:unnamed protein product [Callosobruchus maculatus]|uniref:Reverse transcriptase domain-containing protein n=1 Tax=Callosobruchus maculatus TaxID=64391 RepID=A0A653CRA3_CALMS|nr:unnamed protein product [Callosobruchus maculatus]